MYLKRLESVGFKSFAERIKVDFVPGVTAIVGPNGSGKSNITDAIRWVLGEQSARSLRGTRMEDIIFQGSDSRNSLNVAEVTLVLDNADQALPIDYEEVSVTRRVYRSGASEFYINKQPCRLKDIIDLFLDSGLGKEAFSIIGQGQVEEILSSKAEERRSIFEEAAGVLKYKQRKQESEYKLAETDENLHRINDIIYEIEQQIGPLKEQAKVAERYMEKKEGLKHHEISLLITEIHELHTAWQQILKDLEIEKDVALALKTDIQKRHAYLETSRYEIQQLDEKVEFLQEKLLEETKKLEQLEGQRQVNRERSKHILANEEKLKEQLHQSEDRLKELEKNQDQEQGRLIALKKERDRLLIEKKNLEQQLITGEDELTKKIEQLKTEYIDKLSEQAAKRNEKQSLEQQAERFKHQKDRYLTQSEEQGQELAQYKEGTKQIEAVYLKEQAALRALELELDQKEEELHKREESLYHKQQQLNEGHRILAREKSRRDMLQEMKDDYQGFYHGVKAVLRAKNQGKLESVIGPVVQLFQVPKEYITAIETALGAQAQHIVVETDLAARKAIQYLRDSHNGRATFLPLNTIRERFVPQEQINQIKNLPGFISVAAHVIETEDAYQRVLNHLLGHIILAADLKSANEIARVTNFRYRIVTLEGDVVNPGGSMSGGARQQKQQSLFSRDQDLQTSIEKVKDYEDRIQDFEKTIQSEKESIASLKMTLEEKRKRLADHREKTISSEKKLHDAKQKYEHIDERLKLITADLRDLEQEEKELKERQVTLEESLIQIEKQLGSINEQVVYLTKQQESFHQQEEKLRHKIHEYEIKFAEREERFKNQEERCRSIAEELVEEKQLKTEIIDELASIEASKLSEDEEAALIKNIEETEGFVGERTKEIQALRQKRLDQMQSIEFEERELKEEQRKFDRLNESIQKKEVKATRYDVALENKLSQLQTDYQISYERAKDTYDRVQDVTETRQIVGRIKQEIKNLGTVNLGAIEEYDRLAKRYDFLTEQKDDLVQAKQSLLALIADMDAEMEKRFSKTFSQIKKEFTVVFKELFGGGRADLQLTDPNRLLDTGIEIVAQPPGKKLQHLGLLSGGERALTAIALLFAILRVRPVPFCVLDEVEAALDEANVARFAKYLKMHSEHTQFIVITHRKGTMEEADVLYGVTMQESGVSRLVSVRLEDTVDLVKT